MSRSPFYLQCLSFQIHKFWLYARLLLLGSLDFMINARHFNIKKIYLEFMNLIPFQRCSELTISECAFWFKMPSGGMHLIHLVLLLTAISLISFIAYEGEYFWNNLQRYLFPFQIKDPLYLTFRFLKVICIFTLVFINIIWFFLKTTLTLKIKLPF